MTETRSESSQPEPAGVGINLWESAEHALHYLTHHADVIPHRREGEAALLEWLPRTVTRILDLGSGDGRLLACVKAVQPTAAAVAIDFSDAMLKRLRARFGNDELVAIVAHDLDRPLPASLGTFDVVVSSFAIHHLVHARKREVFAEVFEHLSNGGVFCNLEHVASSTVSLHHQFLATMSIAPDAEDPSNKLLDVETQVAWLRDLGFADADCHWKWRELALLYGRKP